MIASTVVGRWCWGEFDAPGGDVERCLWALRVAHAVLVRHGLSTGECTARLSVAEWGKPKSLLYQGDVRLDTGVGGDAGVGALAGAVISGIRPGRIGSADALVRCTGAVTGTGGLVPVPGPFLLGVSALADFTTVDLETYSDTCMTHNLRGNPQPAAYAANAPRLTGALRGIQEALGWETPVRRGEDALGWLWAADREGAAGFVPADVDDDNTYRAARMWPARLRDAHDRGLTPSRALRELAGLPAAAVVPVTGLAGLRDSVDATGNR
ncbi:hypothetical protein ABT354_13325 [Streptomyces sp. NPDC000594]|uniref:hypothetical protein n=1 Tax=Streptomyces sp. NPDC000594 TaxID=3154261 RepID=UPI003320230C